MRNPIRAAYCRAFQLVFRLALPFLPYREPKQLDDLTSIPPLLQDKNGVLVQTLLKTYEACTGEQATPVAIGGGTYARALKNGVAFGPEMEGDEPVMHQADEYITIERVKLLLDVYQKAIRELTK